MNRRLLVVGAGSIGQRHLRNLRDLDPSAEIAMCPARPRTETAPGCAELGARWLPDLDTAVEWAPDGAVIATPATHHLPVALRLVEAGIPLLIEKPLADSPAQVSELIEFAAAQSVPLLVGYCLRFSPAIAAFREAITSGLIGRPLGLRAEVGQDLATWRPGTRLSETVTASAELGGGALLELSHELDLVCWTFGLPEMRAALLENLGVHGIDVEESVELLVRWQSGLAGTVHLDLVRRPPIRTTTVWGTEGTAVWDGLARTATLQGVDGQEKLLCAGEDSEEMYRRELAHFLRVVEGDEQPAITAQEGMEILQLCEAARTIGADSD